MSRREWFLVGFGAFLAFLVWCVVQGAITHPPL